MYVCGWEGLGECVLGGGMGFHMGCGEWRLWVCGGCGGAAHTLGSRIWLGVAEGGRGRGYMQQRLLGHCSAGAFGSLHPYWPSQIILTPVVA